MKRKQTTQLEMALEQLMALAPNVTTSDRHEIFERYSELTVITYLKGKGKRLDTAMELLKFFQKKIDGRNQILAG